MVCLRSMEAVKNGFHVHLGVSAKLVNPYGDFAGRVLPELRCFFTRGCVFLYYKMFYNTKTNS